MTTATFSVYAWDMKEKDKIYRASSNRSTAKVVIFVESVEAVLELSEDVSQIYLVSGSTFTVVGSGADVATQIKGRPAGSAFYERGQ